MIEKKTDRERLLEIDNVHGAGCGSPPSVDASGKYVGYFENQFGEQWVFIGDRETGEAVVRGGDANWREHRVSLEHPCPASLVLQGAEQRWLMSCFEAMCNTRIDCIQGPMDKLAELLVPLAGASSKT
jgi:hypothetical protein